MLNNVRNLWRILVPLILFLGVAGWPGQAFAHTIDASSTTQNVYVNGSTCYSEGCRGKDVLNSGCDAYTISATTINSATIYDSNKESIGQIDLMAEEGLGCNVYYGRTSTNGGMSPMETGITRAPESSALATNNQDFPPYSDNGSYTDDTANFSLMVGYTPESTVCVSGTINEENVNPGITTIKPGLYWTEVCSNGTTRTYQPQGS